MTFLLAFAMFSVAVAAMGVGVMLSGRKLSTSCGGLSAQTGEPIGECACARKQAGLCDDGPGRDLVELAEVGWPMKGMKRPRPAASGERLEV
jgi:hypothetical protein